MLPPQPLVAQEQSPQPQPRTESNEQPTEETESEPEPEVPEPLQTNPLEPAGTDIDTIIKARINDDLWEAMKGELPCLTATRDCISQLQATATGRNPLLLEIDNRIEEINMRIEEARASNKKSIRLSVLTPALQALLSPQTITQNGRTRTTGGFLSNIISIFTNPVGIVDKLLSAVGVPLLQSTFGGNEQNQRNAIAISDLQVKSAELQRGRAELAQKIREQVYLAVFDYDDAAREFQISQEVAKRDAARMQLLEVEYRFGEGNTNSYLNSLNSLDGKKGQTYRAWATLRSRIEKIKLLVLGVDE
ncbi:hypothetical protein IQ230_23975 [Gloeocapsopsis crepidinum LEGE 06123]|uniref:Outer membrane efflux protein n=1 Tax=Gloeocapsopsis crepidinum LEGE 06123 TaxID=588587 RepID=A0ABR9UYH2_9CHRO|nr:hypothetical protein [Gloeocapsopsis crepidinum]MBE9193344.1 hypothetical protein [Gloeocapsopsis crepidinum LEGE 06123]